MASCAQSEKRSHFTVLVKRPKSGTTLRRHEVRRTPFSERPKMVALYSEPGGESSQLNVKVTKKETLENTVPCDTRVVGCRKKGGAVL